MRLSSIITISQNEAFSGEMYLTICVEWAADHFGFYTRYNQPPTVFPVGLEAPGGLKLGSALYSRQ